MKKQTDKTKGQGKPELPRTFNEALQCAKEAIGFFANGDESHVAKAAKKLWYNLDAVQQGETRVNHADKLAEALRGWQDWADGKRAWPKLETNEALRDYDKSKGA